MVLILWAGPVALLGSWYWLSYYDLSFGFFMLTRQTHDLVFQIYGNILGLPPESLPPLVARAIAVDSLIVLRSLLSASENRLPIGGRDVSPLRGRVPKARPARPEE